MATPKEARKFALGRAAILTISRYRALTTCYPFVGLKKSSLSRAERQ